jgi:hypothetical protein
MKSNVLSKSDFLRKPGLYMPLIMAAAFAVAGTVPALADQNRGSGRTDTTPTDITPNGGNSADHISDRGRLNTNGPNTQDRDLGRDRARERANERSNFDDSDDDRNKPLKPRTTKSTPDGGTSADHISDQGQTNTNGPNAANRTFGRDRADQRDDMKPD